MEILSITDDQQETHSFSRWEARRIPILSSDASESRTVVALRLALGSIVLSVSWRQVSGNEDETAVEMPAYSSS